LLKINFNTEFNNYKYLIQVIPSFLFCFHIIFIYVYSKSCDREHETRYPKLLLQLLKQSDTSIDLFLDAIEQNCDMDKVIKLKKTLEQYR